MKTYISCRICLDINYLWFKSFDIPKIMGTQSHILVHIRTFLMSKTIELTDTNDNDIIKCIKVRNNNNIKTYEQGN